MNLLDVCVQAGFCQIRLHTVNRETFAGLNFCSIHSIWIFTVILFAVKGQGTIYVILEAKDS